MTVIIPEADGQLCIVTNAPSSKLSLAATLYVIREDTPKLAVFSNAKIRPHQTKWLPCETEALCIGASVKFFGPHIRQSKHVTTVFTDSNPYVQACGKLCKGESLASARVMTFSSVLRNYGVKLAHIRGNREPHR